MGDGSSYLSLLLYDKFSDDSTGASFIFPYSTVVASCGNYVGWHLAGKMKSGLVIQVAHFIVYWDEDVTVKESWFI